MLPMCPVWTPLYVARPRGFEPLTFTSGGKSSLMKLNVCDAFRLKISACACFGIEGR